MKTHRFVIKAPVNPNEASIELDGRPLYGVVRVHFDYGVDGLTTLRLDIIGEVVVEGEFRESAIVSVRQAKA